MSYVRSLGAEEVPFDIEAEIKAQREQLAKLNQTAEKELFWRKVSTGAALAGALFAAVRLTDIWLAVRAKRRQHG